MKKYLYIFGFLVILTSCYKQTLSINKFAKEWQIEEVTYTLYDSLGNESSVIDTTFASTMKLSKDKSCTTSGIHELLPNGFWSSSKFGKLDVIYFFNSDMEYADFYLKATVTKLTATKLEFDIFTGDGTGALESKKTYLFKSQ